MTTRLVRTTRSDKVIGGVCGGIARRFGLDTRLVRLLFVASVLLPGPQVLLYAILWAAVPAEDRA